MSTTNHKQMSALCAHIGKDRLIVQGGGGNASWKDGETLWVKASGTRLADAQERDIFVPVALSPLQSAMREGDFAVPPQTQQDSALRPSIETLLHALMPQKYVLHVHAIDPLALLVRADARAQLQACLPDHLSWCFVDYHKPGADLAGAINDAAADLADVDVVFMANHGIVVAADGLPEIEQKLEQVLGATRQPVKHAAIPSTAPTMPAILADNYDWAEGADVKALASRSDLFSLSQSHWVMYPDHAIFLGARPLCARREMLAEGNPIADEADVILLQGEGVLVRRQANPAILEQLQCYGDVLARVDLTAPLQALSDSQIGDLLNWDAEKYRQLQAEKNA